jgi:diguanylate cyclase (GGDEF)-like protein
MSFRRRLTFFFVLIVVVTMVAVGVVVFRLISDSQAGKADARASAFLAEAHERYVEARRLAGVSVARVARDPALTRALVRHDRATLTRVGTALMRREGLARLRVEGRGRPVLDRGSPDAIATAEITLSGAFTGRIVAAKLAPVSFAHALSAPGAGIVVRRGGRLLASTLRGVASRSLPSRGTVTMGGTSYRVATFSGGDAVRVSVLSDDRGTTGAVGSKRGIAIALLVGFLLLALLFAVLVSRALQGQIARFLEAARRLASGDFSTPVPTEGRDEFAALGDEFNKMSEQLERRLEELGQERARLQESIRRIGQSFASNLDRRALLELGMQTAADAVRASCARASVRDPSGALSEGARMGEVDAFAQALDDVEARALEIGRPCESSSGEEHVIALPLAGGMLSLGRRGEGFTAAERELLSSLIGQAALSIENASLHEQVQRQAVTDELTGLSNHRRFQDVMDGELERARRFGHEVGLLMLDIDNFKSVNDTYGHQQGDVVLREVARVVRDASREIDEPARYGGEEMAVTLPETDLEGAFNLAERVRLAIEQLAVPKMDGSGTLQVTASLGVASARGAAKRDLVEAADRALYQAKRSGKNRTIRGVVHPAAVGHGQ